MFFEVTLFDSNARVWIDSFLMLLTTQELKASLIKLLMDSERFAW